MNVRDGVWRQVRRDPLTPILRVDPGRTSSIRDGHARVQVPKLVHGVNRYTEGKAGQPHHLVKVKGTFLLDVDFTFWVLGDGAAGCVRRRSQARADH